VSIIGAIVPFKPGMGDERLVARPRDADYQRMSVPVGEQPRLQ
jgi:hypothetical protein